MSAIGIQPIETHYAGCRFRSRLEARWAVFFDHLRIPWEYEPQGYVTGPVSYLPDFRLPTIRNMLVEVKGDMSEADSDKLTNFVCAAGYECPGLLVLGEIPEPNSFGPHHVWMRHVAWGDEIVEKWDVSIFPLLNSKYTILPFGWPRYVAVMEGMPLSRIPNNHDAHKWTARSGAVIPFAPVSAAYQAARSARFEHGESGVINDILP